MRRSLIVVAVGWLGLFAVSTTAKAAAGGGTRASLRITSHPEALVTVSTATFAFSSTSSRARYACALDKRSYAACRSPKTYRRLSPGAHTFAVKAAVGGVFGTPARYKWTIASRPTVRIVSNPASPSRSLDPTFTFSSDHDVATFRCSLDGAAYAACYTPTTLGPLAKGNHTFAVKASDDGLTSEPATFRWTIATSGGDVGTVLAALANATTVAQAEQALNVFFAQYNMKVAITDIRPSLFARTWISWSYITQSDLPALKVYGLILLDEWAKYPIDWIRATHVTGLQLITHMSVTGQIRAAAPDFYGNAVYYDIGYSGTLAGLPTNVYARQVVHHEFDHLVNWTLFDSFRGCGFCDPAWAALNPPGFRYGGGGASCYLPSDPCQTHREHPSPGFVTGYAASATEEDKAELFAWLMETSSYRKLKTWIASGDGYLAAKVANYQRFLCSHSTAMCGDYFDAINGA